MTARAEPLLREALARKQGRLGREHPDVAEVMSILSAALDRLGTYAESEQLMRGALAINAKAYTGPNSHVAGNINNLANVLVLEGRFGEAEQQYAQSLAIDHELAPASAFDEATTVGNLARLRFRQGAYAEAEAGLRDAIERKQKQLGADYADNGRSYDLASLAEVLVARGRFDEAATLADRALAQARSLHRDASPDAAFALSVQAELMLAGGDATRAAGFAQQAVAMYDALGDRRSDKAARACLLFGHILQALGRSSEARATLERALVAAAAVTPKAASLVAHIEAELSGVDASLHDAGAAIGLQAGAEALLAEIPRGPNREREAIRRLLAASPSGGHAGR